MRIMITFLIILVYLGWPEVVFAQDQLPEPQLSSLSDPAPPPPGLVVPIDTGIVILLISGLILGGIFCLNCRKKIF